MKSQELKNAENEVAKKLGDFESSMDKLVDRVEFSRDRLESWLEPEKLVNAATAVALLLAARSAYRNLRA